MKPEIKNLKKAAERILKAVKKKEKIILYGDSDLDGISSVIIIKEAVKNLGGEITDICFVDRETEGYGLNENALNYLKKHSPALLVVLDCGISNLTEVKIANKLGFEVIIVDHHQPLKKLPAASIIVNPKQKGDKYPFKAFAAAGVTFRLAEVLLKRKLTPSLKANFLELVSLATIADMMPQTDDNLEFLDIGLKSLKSTPRPGLRAFWNIDIMVGEDIRQLSYKIISACHAGSSKNYLNECYLLLTSTSIDKAENMVKNLLEKAYVRHERIKEIAKEVEKRVLKKKEEAVIFEGDRNWPVLMLGPSASKICHIYKKPVFIYSQKSGYCQGGVRTPPGINAVKAMMHCSKNLETYGGHPQAAGFRTKEKDLVNFKKCLIKYFSGKIKP